MSDAHGTLLPPSLPCRYDVLQCLNEKEGVLAEALFQTYFGALPSIISSTKHVHNKHGARYDAHTHPPLVAFSPLLY